MFPPESILYIGLSQALFAIFVLISRGRVQRHDYVLAICLAVIGFKFFIHLFALQHGKFFDAQFSMGLIPLTFGPFIYLYTCFITRENRKFYAKDLWHFLPFFLMTILYFAFFKDIVDFNDVAFLKQDGYILPRLFFASFLLISTLGYTYLIFRELKNYRALLTNFFSFKSSSNELIWVNALAALYSITFLSYVIVGSANAIMQQELVPVDTLSHIGLTILAFTTSYFGIKQPSLFWSVRNEDLIDAEGNNSSETDDLKKERYLEDEDVLKYKVQLEDYMKKERPYLKTDLTLNDLSTKLNIPKHDATLLLNKYLNKNFFQFINEYRAEEVIQKLNNPDFDHLTIQAIAYDSGFNSKSSFNAFFKQFTGSTPSQYKQKMNSQSEDNQ